MWLSAQIKHEVANEFGRRFRGNYSYIMNSRAHPATPQVMKTDANF